MAWLGQAGTLTSDVGEGGAMNLSLLVEIGLPIAKGPFGPQTIAYFCKTGWQP